LYGNYRDLLGAYQKKEYRVAAGKVENYWYEKRYNRRKKETTEREGFTVNGVRFAYIIKEQSAFTNHQAARVPFHNGMMLRVSYVPCPQFGSPEPLHQIIKLEAQLPTTNDQCADATQLVIGH
ncbi:MAG TPA: hypothetical protein VF646_17705, partial [Cytophagales bacterium]|jgi:hypothetical protein